MTATRERPSAPSPNDGAALAWADRSAFPTVRGRAWWVALAFSIVPTALGTLADVLLWTQPGLLFTACFFVASVMSVLLVRRRNLFGPMVIPPLVLAVTMPVVVLFAGPGVPEGGGTTATALALASPLINAFPTMAATTATTLIVGLVRMFVLERRPAPANADAPTRKMKPRTPAAGKDARKSSRAEKAAARSGEPGGKRPTATKPPREEGRPTRDSGRTKEPGRGRPAAEPPPGKGRPGEQQPGKGQGQAPQPGKSRGGAAQPGKDRAREQPPGKGRNPAPPPGQGRTGKPHPGNGRGSEPPPGRGSTPPPGRRAPSRQAPGRGEPPPSRRSGDEPQRPPGNQPPRPPGGRPQRPTEKPQRPPENQPRPPGGPPQPPPGNQPPRRPRPPRRDPG